MEQVSLHTLSSSLSSKYGTSHPRQIELTRMVINDFIVGLDLPLSIIEKPAFLKAMKAVDPKFQVPSRRAITHDHLPKIHEQITNQLKHACSTADHVSLTIDGWTDRRMRSFYAVTIHYIDQVGQLKAHLLAFNPLIGSHTGENLFSEYDRVSTAFSIENKIVRIITDNASNNLSLFGDLIIPGFESYFATEDDNEDINDDEIEVNLNMSEGNCLDENDIDEVQYDFDKREELLRLPCFIHTMQLVVKDGLKESGCTRSAMTKVAGIAKLSHKSIPVAEKLQELKLIIPLAIVTRWNSQFITVSKILDIPSVFLNELLTEQKKTELVLSTKDLSTLREFISIFTLLVEATTRTQAEESISISLVAPSLLEIYYDLENESKVCRYSSSLCNKLIQSLKERFGDLLINLEIPVDDRVKRRNTFNLFSDNIFLISSFLDGRFRLRWILQSALPQDKKNLLCDKIRRLVAEASFEVHKSSIDLKNTICAEAETPATSINNDSSEEMDVGGNSTIPKRKSLFAYCETSKMHAKKRRVNIMYDINEEIMLLLKDPNYLEDLIFMKKTQFLYLHRLALKVLCVPATSAPAERVFSQSGLLMRPHRNRLSKEMLSRLALIKCNMDLLK